MHNDDKSPKTTSKNEMSNEEITSDELLERLRRSLGSVPDSAGKKKDKKASASIPKIPQSSSDLKIDEDVYESAKDSLLRDDESEIGEMDIERDLDVDALIRMYIPDRKSSDKKDDIVDADAEGAESVKESDAEAVSEAVSETVGEAKTADGDGGTDDLLAVADIVEPVAAVSDTEATDSAEGGISGVATEVAHSSESASSAPAAGKTGADDLSEGISIPEYKIPADAGFAGIISDAAKSNDVGSTDVSSDGVISVDANSFGDKTATSAEHSVDNSLDEEYVKLFSSDSSEGGKRKISGGSDDDSSYDNSSYDDNSYGENVAIHNTGRETTVVYDAEKVRAAAHADTDDFERTIDEALDYAATEEFQPVSGDSSANVGEKVYGTGEGSSIEQKDVDIMVALGMNKELEDAVGAEAADKYVEDIFKKQEIHNFLNHQGHRSEYTSRDQNEEIRNNINRRYFKLLLKILGSVAVLIMTFFYENIAMLGGELPSFARPDAYPIVYTMLDLQLVVFCGALVYRHLADGVIDLIKLKPTPDSVTLFVFVSSLIYTFAACMFAPREGFSLFNLPVAIVTLFTLLYEFINLKREAFGFNVISSKRPKFVATSVTKETESLEREAFGEYLGDNAQVIRAVKTDFVDGFWVRCGDRGISNQALRLIIPISAVISIAFFIISLAVGKGTYNAFTNGFLSVMLTMPFAIFAVYSYPFYKASKDSYEEDSAIIGDASFGDYASASVISFEDKEVFPSEGVRVTSVKVYGNNRIDEIIYNFSSAFGKVGGPLADVFKQATRDLGNSENVVLQSVDDDGFTVLIDEIEVNIGKASYMEKHDFETPFDAEDRKIEQVSMMGILYIAYQGQLAAKIYVQYTVDNDFIQILEQLYSTGVFVGIKSFDPNINDEMLAKKLKKSKYPVKVIRSRNVEDIPHTLDHCDSGIASRRSVKALLKAVNRCERANMVLRTGTIIKMLAMLVGAVIMAFILGFGSEMTISSFLISLYQILWVVPVVILSHLFIR